jgi:hypothetical protein
MAKNILDEHLAFQRREEIPDRVLVEILHSKKKYPTVVVELASQEIQARNLVPSEIAWADPSLTAPKSSLPNWIQNNPDTAVLALLAAVFSGFTGSIIVVISVYASIQENELIKKGIWRKTNLLTLMLIIGAILTSCYM